MNWKSVRRFGLVALASLGLAACGINSVPTAEEAAKAGAHGIVCGHIHHAANEVRSGIHYINTGDWVESCTAVVEHFDGRIELIDWSEITRERAKRRAPVETVNQSGNRQAA